MKNTVRRILGLWRPHKWLAAGLGLTLVLRTLFTVVLALSLKLIIDRIVAGDSGQSSVGIVVLLVAGYFISAGAAVFAGYLEAIASARILADVRSAAFQHLQRLSIGFHNRAERGEILARFSTDIAELATGAVKKPRQALQAGMALALFFPVMLLLEWRLAMLAAVATPAAVFIANRVTPDAAKALDTEKRLVAGVLEEVNENLQAQAEIRAFGLHRRSTARFGDRLNQLKVGSVTANFRVLLLAAISEFAVAFVQLAIVGVGAVLALRGDLAAGDFAAFVALLTEAAYQTTVIASDVIPELARAGAGIRRIDELLAAGPVTVETEGGGSSPSLSSGIQFEAVDFSYGDSAERQLDRVVLTLPAQRRIAVVGTSGSGKSTLLNLLLRFYDPDAGRVTVDSLDLRTVDLAEYREKVGVVFQDTFLFNASVADNIRVARPGASDAEVAEAAAEADLTEMIKRFPSGFDTLLGPGGRRLSGGQRQRIGIARAVLRAPSLLLLDEVTSALDPVTEAAVNATLDRLAVGRTVISITHRLQSAASADLVVVMDGGRVVEQGTFAELQAGGGLLANMWEKQSGFVISGDGRAGVISPERLRAIPLFSEVDADLLPELAGTFAADHFVTGEDIFGRGDPADRFHIIARGVTEVIRHNGQGDGVVAHLEDGDFFGEMAFLDDAPRNATVRAVTPTLTLSLNRAQFDDLLASSPGTAEMIRQVAASRTEANRL